MITKNNEEGIPIGEQIVKQLGNPKRAKTLHALNKRIEICEKLIRENKDELTPIDYEVIEEYKKEVSIQENYLTTEVKVMQLKNIRLPPKQFAKERMDLLDKHQERHKNILQGTYKENITESNFVRNSEAMDKLLDEVQPQQQETKHWSDRGFVPGIHPPRERKQPRVYFMGESFLTDGNIGTIVAEPGSGKSPICESILANVLNNDCEALGFKVDEGIERAIFFDGERDLDLVGDSNNQMLKRANVTEHKEQCLIVGLREVFTIKEKKEIIVEYVEGFKPQLILIDGVADLMSNTNSEEETSQLYLWLMELIVKNNLAIITTLHPNKNTLTARGWIGSEMLRRCESIMSVKINGDESRTMVVTKARKGTKPSNSFRWDKEMGLMVGCELKPGNRKKPLLMEALSLYDIEVMKNAIDKDKQGQKVGYKYKELITTIQHYIKEEHPRLAVGENGVGVFIKDLCHDEVHIKKIGKAPLTTYAINLIVDNLNQEQNLIKEGNEIHNKE